MILAERCRCSRAAVLKAGGVNPVVRMSGMMRKLFRHSLGQPDSLTERQQQLIQASSAKLLPVRETAIALFCERLSALDPRLRALFDGEDERTGLMTAISTVTEQCHHLKQLVPSLRAMGRRCDDQGMTDRDYDSVAAALIWTLERELGAEFTTEMREAWTACYRIVANGMKSAAAEQKVRLLPPC